jgi:hypothetical protein
LKGHRELMKRSKLITQLRSILHQAESPRYSIATGVIGESDTEFEFNLELGERERVISETRLAISLTENPRNEFSEFEILDSGFCFDFDREH